MIKIDQSTLVLIATSVTLLSSLLLAYLKYISRHVKGPYYWSVGNLLISISFITFVFKSVIGAFFTFVVGATAAILGISLFYVGIRKFCNKPVNIWLPIGFTIFNLLQGSILTLFLPNAKIRMIIYSILHIALALIMVVEFIRIKEKSYRTLEPRCFYA